MNNNEPVILGKVKKGGASKPILIIIIFLFIGGSIFLLPTILNYFGDYSIIDLVKNGEIIDFIENHDKYMNGNISLKTEKKETTTKIVSTNYISNITVIDSDGFQLTNFNLTKESISFDVNVNNSVIIIFSVCILNLSKTCILTKRYCFSGFLILYIYTAICVTMHISCSY